jgi:hypothetical protein
MRPKPSPKDCREVGAKDSSLLRNFLSTPEPPELGPGPRAEVEPLGTLNRRLDEDLRNVGLAGEPGELVRGAVLLWHDHFDAAHAIAQEIENRNGSYLHAILHRREPDYSNARYWFHRVGQHPCFGELAARTSTLLKASGDSELETKLIPRGQWDPLAFVAACEAVAGRAGSDATVRVLREIQRSEFELLLTHHIRNHAVEKGS